MHEFDFLVIGSGAAGLSFALRAAKRGSVAVLSKNSPEVTNTSYAQGGISCPKDDEDSIESHLQDTLIAGAGLCNKDIARGIIKEAPASIERIVSYGVEFDKSKNLSNKSGSFEYDDYELGREGGHSARRILHCKDETGKEIQNSLLERAKAQKNITFFPNHYVIDLIRRGRLALATGDRCLGFYALQMDTGKVFVFRGAFTVLAAGGCGRVYLYTSNPPSATGDGVAIAWRARATISNMEFIQFHPTCLYHRDKREFLISEAMRGEGAELIDEQGRDFMKKYHNLGSLAPRDIVARAIDSEIKRTGSPCVYLDATKKGEDFLRRRFPYIYGECAKVGIDIAKQPIPVVPAAHYQCGGARTDEHGRTDLPGLYAVGESAYTGLHGANRLASNSLLEAVVMGDRAARHALAKFEDARRSRGIKAKADRDLIPEWQSGSAVAVDELAAIYHNWDELRRLMWDYACIVRTDKRLRRAASRLRNLKREMREFYWNYKVTAEILELRNLIDSAALIIECAAMRKESRGLHYSLDYPELGSSAIDTLVNR